MKYYDKFEQASRSLRDIEFKIFQASSVLFIGNIRRSVLFGLCIVIILLFTNNQNALAQSTSVDFFKKPFSVKYEKGIAKQIVAGIDTFFTNYTKRVISERKKYWHRQFGSLHAYKVSVDPNRVDLRKMIGATDTLGNVRLLTIGHPNKENSVNKTSIVGETQNTTIYEVKWTVRKTFTSEGLLLLPKGTIKASAVVIPDADETPEEYADLKPGPDIALRLAERGIKVLIPVLVNRGTQYAGNGKLYAKNQWMINKPTWASQWTNETNREWIWRQGFIMGHSLIGMGVQKVLAAVDWLKHSSTDNSERIGVMGYGAGGLLALYSAAIDTSIDAAWVSGYFGPRKNLWREPVSRDIWGLLTGFGDANIASLIALRSLIIEESPVPRVKLPKPPRRGQRNYALPGELDTPSKAAVKQIVEKLKNFFPEHSPVQPDVTLFSRVTGHGTSKALKVFANCLGLNIETSGYSHPSIKKCNIVNIQKRQRRVFYNEQ
jgi:dienelactone hydrolase